MNSAQQIQPIASEDNSVCHSILFSITRTFERLGAGRDSCPNSSPLQCEQGPKALFPVHPTTENRCMTSSVDIEGI